MMRFLRRLVGKCLNLDLINSQAFSDEDLI
jgi:hypothetical protein